MGKGVAICAVVGLFALAVPAGTSGEPTATVSAGFQDCAVPENTFYKSIRARGVGCGKARTVLTRGKCQDDFCSVTTHGAWRCKTKGGIAFRTTRCNGPGNKFVIATAAGD